MIVLLALFLLLLFFGGGFAIHALWIIAAIILVIALIALATGRLQL